MGSAIPLDGFRKRQKKGMTRHKRQSFLLVCLSMSLVTKEPSRACLTSICVPWSAPLEAWRISVLWSEFASHLLVCNVFLTLNSSLQLGMSLHTTWTLVPFNASNQRPSWRPGKASVTKPKHEPYITCQQQ